jgi:copper chaperone CopZ
MHYRLIYLDLKNIIRKGNLKMKIKVLDMTCKHCVAKIEKSLLVTGLKAKVDLSEQSIEFKKESDLELVKEAIVKAGYTPSL